MSSRRRSVWVFVVLRLVFFAVPFAVLYLLNITPWIAAIFAALIGMSLSIIFLSRPKSDVSSSIADWRNRRKTNDEVVEDELLETQVPEPNSSAPNSSAPNSSAPNSSEREGDPEQHSVRE